MLRGEDGRRGIPGLEDALCKASGVRDVGLPEGRGTKGCGLAVPCGLSQNLITSFLGGLGGTRYKVAAITSWHKGVRSRNVECHVILTGPQQGRPGVNVIS